MNAKMAIAVAAALCGGCAGTGAAAWAKVSAAQLDAARRHGVPAAIENSVGMRMVLIPEGQFVMGSPAGESGRNEIETPHDVRLTRAFYMCITEVTQEQYRAVTGLEPSYRKQAGGPVEQVSVFDVQAFLDKLSKKEGRTYRLPTEAQWEYACRAGTATQYSFGDDVTALGDYAWFKDNSDNHSHPVAQKKPNAWGLYDMHGNVWEWVNGYYVPYGQGAATDPIGRRSEVGRGREVVMRGGAFAYPAVHTRSAMRYRDEPQDRHDIIGFRPIVEIE